MNDKKDGANVYNAFTEVKNKNWLDWEECQNEDYKEYRRRWETYPKQLKIPDYPMHLDIEMSSRCNLKCTFCARTVRVEAGTWRPIRDIEVDLFYKIVDEAAANGVYALNLNILGEPLLHKKLPELVSYAKDRGMIDVFFHTNGMLLDEKRSIALIKSGLDKLIISFDSPYKEKFERVRVGANYERIIENVRRFKEIRNNHQSMKPVTRINFIKLPDMELQEIDDMIALFSPLVDSIGLLDYIDPYKKVAGNFNKDYKSKFVCSQILTRLTIYEDGRVFPCCMDYDDELYLGNLNTQSIKEIWKSKKLAAIRKAHIDGKFFKIPSCASCEFALKGDADAS